MDFGFVRIYYLEEIAECRANAPGWETHWGLPKADCQPEKRWDRKGRGTQKLVLIMYLLYARHWAWHDLSYVNHNAPCEGHHIVPSLWKRRDLKMLQEILFQALQLLLPKSKALFFPPNRI